MGLIFSLWMYRRSWERAQLHVRAAYCTGASESVSEEAYGWMLRQSAPAAGGLQRGDFPRLTFLHYLAHGVSEPQGCLAACTGGLHGFGLGIFFFALFALPWLQSLPVSRRRTKQTPGGK